MFGCLILTDESAAAQGSVRQRPGSWPGPRRLSRKITHPDRAQREHVNPGFCVVLTPEYLVKYFTVISQCPVPTALRMRTLLTVSVLQTRKPKGREVKHLNFVQ